ncbi:hypothetical protein NMY22_g17653 [Coprinellus aureogranulatus]|nr:hypothetical protein NMY22_g17653 [Coprinellus aureogranulatus]
MTTLPWTHVLQNWPQATIALAPHSEAKAAIATVGPNGKGKSQTVDDQTSLVVLTARSADWDSISVVARVSIIAKRRRVSLISDYIPFASVQAEASDAALLALIFFPSVAILVGVIGLLVRAALAVADWSNQYLSFNLPYVVQVAGFGKGVLKRANCNAHDTFQAALQYTIARLEALRGEYVPALFVCHAEFALLPTDEPLHLGNAYSG